MHIQFVFGAMGLLILVEVKHGYIEGLNERRKLLVLEKGLLKHLQS